MINEGETESTQVETSQSRGVIRPFITALGVVLVLAWVLFPPQSYDGVAHHLFRILPVGWFTFLSRTVPSISMSGSALGLAFLVAMGAAILIHRLGRWASGNWTWRSTVAATLIPLVLFGIVMSAAGTQARIVELSERKGRYERTGGSALTLEQLHKIHAAGDEDVIDAESQGGKVKK